MTTIVHRTPGLLDIRALTTMGLSAKPDATTAIGQFGTGLKYAIAGLVRSGADVSIWIGREHWQFGVDAAKFRDREYGQVYAWRRAWGGLRRTRVTLPFTSSLGPHWQPWMWMRELHANTLDEGGETLTCEREEEHWAEAVSGVNIFPEDDQTLICVTLDAYTEAWDNRDGVFLPGASRQRNAGTLLEELDGPAEHLYYRGLRVLDLRSPALRSWNILRQTPLTEDRTMPEYYARQAVAEYIVRSEDEDLIEAVLTADETQWEHELDFPSWVRPTDTFARVARRVQTPARVRAYVGGYYPSSTTTVDTRTAFERHIRPWSVEDDGDITDALGCVVVPAPGHDVRDPDEWRTIAEGIVEAIGGTVETF